MSVPKKASARELRRVLGAAAPAIQQLGHNDQVTQQRIVALEGRMNQCEAFLALSFRERVRWIFKGEA